MSGTINWGIFKRHFWGELLRHQQTVRFVAFPRADTLLALPRAVAAFLFCAFDCFLRLAMIAP
jgi:hypothetical protein